MHTKDRGELVDGLGLDPADWEELRGLGHRMVDDAIEWWSTLRERPVWRPVPAEVRARLEGGLPQEGGSAEEAYEDFLRDVLPYPHGVPHPRFWGWVNGSGLPIGAFADFLATTMNSNAGAFQQSATYVERQVLGWLKEMLDFPAATSALLTSGCSHAQVIALAAARNAKAAGDVRRDGLGREPRRLTLYGSVETHNSVRKAVELLGLGGDALRALPVDEEYRMDIQALRQAIAADRAAGLQPSCVIGTAGTVNTGATDDLERLADVCAEEGLWFHVDGAFGSLAWLAPELRGPLEGLQRADSLAFDLHKWLYLQNDVGCVFVRDEVHHRGAFELSAPYLSELRGGPASEFEGSFKDYGPELTRRFRALKPWMSLKQHGVRKLGEAIRQNVLQARYLAGLIESSSELELLAPVPLNVVAYRFVNPDLSPGEHDLLNRELLVRMQESGSAVPSHTTLRGRFGLRMANTNHRSRPEDFEFLAQETLRLGRELIEEVRSGRPQWALEANA